MDTHERIKEAEKFIKDIRTAVAVIIIVLIAALLGTKYYNMPERKIQKAKELYGTEYCDCIDKNNDEGSVKVSLPATETVRCPLCHKEHTNNWLGQSLMCDECLEITGRCPECSKLLRDKKHKDTETEFGAWY